MKLTKIVNYFWGKPVLRAPLTAIGILSFLSTVSLTQALLELV